MEISTPSRRRSPNARRIFVRLADHQIFGELQRQPFGSAAGFVEHLPDEGHHVALREFEDRYVEGEADRRAATSIDPRRLRGERAQSPGSDFQDRAGLFRDSDEPAGRLQAERPVIPPHQGLRPDQRPGAEVELRLIVEEQLLIRDGGLQLARQPNAVARVPLVGGGEGLRRVAGLRLRPLQRRAGLPDELERVRVGGSQREAGRELDRQRRAREHEARLQQLRGHRRPRLPLGRNRRARKRGRSCWCPRATRPSPEASPDARRPSEAERRPHHSRSRC